jgi:hypothetical protein
LGVKYVAKLLSNLCMHGAANELVMHLRNNIGCRHIWLAKDAPVLMPWVVGLIGIAYLLMILWFHKIILLLKKAVQEAKDGQYDDKDD